MAKVTFEVKNCHVCKAPCTHTCTDCSKPICGKHYELAAHRDKQFRCTEHHKAYVKQFGDGIK